MTSPAALKEAVLTWVNRKRVEFRQAPLQDFPKAIRRSQRDCALAAALPGVALVGVGQYKINDGPWLVLPPNATEFYRRFDAGEYPDLELGS